MKKAATRGRKPKPEGEALTEYVGLKFRKADRDLLEAAAEAAGKSLSDWARDVLLKAARRKR